ncbi:MAG: shikimate kinase [Bacteroidetes bacterium]|nr:MAG: shikimate kinase [Bacteroidota bacterium]
MNDNIFLIGYMGSGKTTLGLKIANQLNRKFIDLDQEIENREGKSITEIFETIGEEGFRKIERKYLLKVLEEKESIIALGGGTPCFFDNMELINKNNCTVYLKVSAFIIQQRLEKEVENRPILNNMTAPEMMEFIQQQIGEREKYYLKSNIINDGNSLNELIKIIQIN